MLDADICIAVMKRPSVKLARELRANKGFICISTIVLAELRFGVANSKRHVENLAELEGFLTFTGVLPFSERAADHYGNIRVDLSRAGTPIGPNDMLIAAHARAEGLTLVTNNEREFKRVPGLKIVNWLK